MRIAVHTHITNPVTSGYLTFLASVESWARLADQVFVIDGHSTDNSLDLLNRWVKGQNVTVISKPETHWGTGRDWAWPQIAINRQVGLEAASAYDWAIHVDADHLATDAMTRQRLENALESAKHGDVWDLKVLSNSTGTANAFRRRAWIVRTGARSVAYGMEAGQETGLDYPVKAQVTRTFRDPITNHAKSYTVGPRVPSSGVVDVEVVKFGHLFFEPDQLLAKCIRLDEGIARYLGQSRRLELQTMFRNCLAWTRPSYATELPASIVRVLSSFETQSMHGLRVPQWTRLQLRLAMAFNAYQTVATRRLRGKGLVGLLDILRTGESAYVADVYDAQDRLGF